MAGWGTVARDYGSPFIMRMDNTGGASGTEVLYLGEAEPGTATSAAKWRIKKFTYDAGTNNVSQIDWADGNDNFDNIWTNRANLSYS